jgi:hypothetical protein
MIKKYALLNKNNLVINISIADDSWDSTGWVEYTDNNPAFINGDYVNGYFYPAQPYSSWTRNQGQWIAPTPMPTDGKRYYWSENDLSWREVQ